MADQAGAGETAAEQNELARASAAAVDHNSWTENDMAQLAFTRCGAGAPLILLHGIGSSRRAWDPVVPLLAEHFDVLAVDLPGFGDSAPLPPQQEPEPAALAARVRGLLAELDITSPHVVGNSLGGWVALELARRQRVSSLTLLSPAGLWSGRTPRYTRVSLQATRWLTLHDRGLLSRLVSFRAGRIVVLGQSHGRPTRLTAQQARTTVEAMAGGPGFDATFKASDNRRIRDCQTIDAAVTVAFGSRDFILLPHQSRQLDQLPAATILQTVPGCGHIPMFDDPLAVTAVIIASAARSSEPLSPGVHGEGLTSRTTDPWPARAGQI